MTNYRHSMKSLLSPIHHPGPYGVAGLPLRRKPRGAGWHPILILAALVAVLTWGAAIGRFLSIEAMKPTPLPRNPSPSTSINEIQVWVAHQSQNGA